MLSMKIRITKTQKELGLYKGDYTKVLAVDVKSCGIFENRPTQERNERLLDEDDEDYLDKKEEQDVEVFEKVETYFLVVNRKKQFVWMESDYARATTGYSRNIQGKDGKKCKNNSSRLRRNTL